MKILLTAFEPFGGENVNPAQEAVKLVRDEIAGARIIKIDVPVVFGESIDTVRKMMEKEKPDAVLCIGQAGGRTGLTPERVAINIDDARIPDNAGNQQSACGSAGFSGWAFRLFFQPAGEGHDGSDPGRGGTGQPEQYGRNLRMQPSDVRRAVPYCKKLPRDTGRFHACAFPA